MANVTVLGAGGATVTIALSSATNAVAAQTALTAVSGLVTSKVLDQTTFVPGSTVPSPTNLLGGLIMDKAGNAGALVSNYVSAVVNATGKSTIVGSNNAKASVVAGDGSDLTYLNVSSNANIFLGTGNHFIVNALAGTSATVTSDAGGNVYQSQIAGTKMVVNAGDKSLSLVNSSEGSVTIAAAAGASITTAVQGNGPAPVTVTGATGSSIAHLAIGGRTMINPGAANVTVFGSAGAGPFTGTTTVFGGSAAIGGIVVTAPAFTGKLTVVDGQGYFAGGTAGGNLLFTSTIAGSATLVGGGTGDVLFSQGAGQLLIAGAGAETLTGFQVAASVGGSTFFGGGGNATIFGNTGGGNTFGFGAGLSLIDGRDETRAGALKANTYFEGAKGGTHLVSDFVSGTDKLNLSASGLKSSDATISFFTAGASGSPFGGAAGTKVSLSSGTTILFFDTGKDGLQDFKASDIA